MAHDDVYDMFRMEGGVRLAQSRWNFQPRSCVLRAVQHAFGEISYSIKEVMRYTELAFEILRKYHNESLGMYILFR